MSSTSARSRPAHHAGLSYHTSTYWDHRFSTDPREQDGFEWLSPSTTLLSLLTAAPTPLVLRDPPVRILHIGVGTSRLSLDIVRYLSEHAPRDWRERAKRIVNVDFSKQSVEFQQKAERQWLAETGDESSGDLMEYHVLDLLDWKQVQTVLERRDAFDVVLDKSTTDSISTGEDTPCASISADTHQPAMLRIAEQAEVKGGGVATTQVLGIHLGTLVKPGGLWLCHSYSSDRWDDVLGNSETRAESEQGGQVWPWKQIDRVAVPVESSDPNAPQINHYIYTMQRT